MSGFELLSQGVNLMVLGMGGVFMFLCILIATMSLAERLANAVDGPAEKMDQATGGGVADDGELIAAIGVAIARYRGGRAG